VAQFQIVVVNHGWERFDELLDLSYAILYGPFGVARETEWYHPAHGSEFAVALAEDSSLLGTARLLPAPGDSSRQVRQVVVAPSAQGAGVGRALMATLERIAIAENARDLWLHSRESAIPFYERLGYAVESDRFISDLTGIAHKTMRKRLVR
jgi:predicted GNAT family N-acyltransferase